MNQLNRAVFIVDRAACDLQELICQMGSSRDGMRKKSLFYLRIRRARGMALIYNLAAIGSPRSRRRRLHLRMEEARPFAVAGIAPLPFLVV